MNKAIFCRLCINVCKDFKELFDDSGACNEIYETTVKYFDPMILSLEQTKQPVICFGCWCHIDDFHNFQLSVLAAQSKLNQFENPCQETVVKTEDVEELEPIVLLHSNNPQDDSCAKPVTENEDEKDILPLPDLNTIDDHFTAHTEFSSDDEKPLIECIKKIKKDTRRKTCKPTNEEEKLPKKRGRKPKNLTATKAHNLRKTVSEKRHDIEEHIQKENEVNIDDNTRSGEDKLENKVDQVVTKTQRTSKEIDDYIAQWKRDLECYVCSETSKSMHLLRQHFRREHPKTRCYVLCCQRKLSRRHHLEAHIRYHVDPAAFKCQLCGKCCTNKQTLSNHMFEQHTEEGQQRPHECPICHKRFAKKPVWKRHIEIHDTSKDFECKQCGKGFQTEQRLNIHERTVHNADHVCDQCGKTIHGIYALRQHVLEHAGVPKKKWPCDQCSAELISHGSLKRHKQVAHNDGSTAYICGECGKVSASAIALRSHKKYVHEAKLKYQCTLCHKAFKKNIGLREHMASHTGEDLYTCPHCPKTFKVSSNMHHHRKKAHPKEWAEARLKRPVMPTVDVNPVAQVVM